MKWNPYYVAYVLAHGHHSVHAMLAADRHHRSSGYGYRIWIMARWSEWGALRGWYRDAGGQWHEGGRSGRMVCMTDADREHFAGWLHGTARRIAEDLAGRQVSSNDRIAAAQESVSRLRCPIGHPRSWVERTPSEPTRPERREQLSLALVTLGWVVPVTP